MIVILTSDLNHYYKENGINFPKQIDNTNYLVDHIKDNLNDTNGVLFIPSDINNSNKIKEYFDIFINALKLSGITFKDNYLLTKDNKNNIKEYINNSNLIFLSGGDTYTQHLLFEELNLKELLKNYNGIIIGQSAGSINLATTVYNSPEDYNENHIYFEGLGYTNITIDPHFILDTKTLSDSELYRREHVLQESYNRDIYGIPDGSHILVTYNESIIYGDAYLIKNGNIELINNNKDALKIR